MRRETGAERTLASGELPGSTRSDLLFSCDTEASTVSNPRSAVQPVAPRSMAGRNGVPACSPASNQAAASGKESIRIKSASLSLLYTFGTCYTASLVFGHASLRARRRLAHRVGAHLDRLPATYRLGRSRRAGAQPRNRQAPVQPGIGQGNLAPRLGQPLGTVKIHIRMGMMKLRSQLGTLP